MERLWFWGGFIAATLAGAIANGAKGASAAGFAYVALNALLYSACQKPPRASLQGSTGEKNHAIDRRIQAG